MSGVTCAAPGDRREAADTVGLDTAAQAVEQSLGGAFVHEIAEVIDLAATIEQIAQSCRDPETGGRLDFARFDIRYASEADFARGERFTIVEFNGTSSESTSMYDPTKSLWWTYGLLFRHWARLFRLGYARRREGAAEPVGERQLPRLHAPDGQPREHHERAPERHVRRDPDEP